MTRKTVFFFLVFFSKLLAPVIFGLSQFTPNLHVFLCALKHAYDISLAIIISLEPYKPLVIFPLIPSGIKSAPSGTYVKVSCEVVASPSPTRYWKKDGKVTRTCAEDYTNNCILVFPKARMTDLSLIHI